MKRIILGLTLACISAASQADIYGLTISRTADVHSEPQITAEGGVSLEGDITTFGGRVNYKVAPGTLAYGTLANVDMDGASGMAFGGGVVHQFEQNFFNGFNTAVKGSYHMWSEGPLDTSDFGAELLISPIEQTVAEGVKLFGMVGFHRLSVETDFGLFGKYSDSNIELALGGGAIKQLGKGEAYVSVELIDEMFIGAGYRLALGQ